MGNCCGIHGSTTSLRIQPMPRWSTEKEELLDQSRSEPVSGGGGCTGDQVRIRISKQQLEVLLRRVELDDHHGSGTHRRHISVEQVVQRLIDESDDFEIHHSHKSWRPSLESIPEVN